MNRWKSTSGKSQRREEKKREDQRRESVRRKKIQVREKVGKSRITVFFQWFEAPEGRKVGSLKRRVRSQLARWEMKNCTPLWREAHFQVKLYKAHQVRTTFGSWDVEKVHAGVARSTFPSQNAQSTPGLDHFWKLRWKSARRCGTKRISKSTCTNHTRFAALLEVEMKSARSCGAKHVSKSKCTKHTRFGTLLEVKMKSARSCGVKHISKSECTKHTRFGALFEVAMLKKCTQLWREADFQLKVYKAHQVRTIFGSRDEKVHAVVAWSTFGSQNVQNTPGSEHF